MSITPKKCLVCGTKFAPKYRVTKRYWATRKYCSPQCTVAGQKGQPRSTRGKSRLSLSDRFWAKVNRGSPGQCWLWTGAIGTGGYGKLGGTRYTKGHKAHRASYEINVGPIPDGLCVCHKCDTPACVNPRHLFLGTLAENNSDRVSKGRGSSNKGVLNPRAKLNFGKAEEIRALYSGGMTQQAIADAYGVSQFAVSQVCLRKRWTEE